MKKKHTHTHTQELHKVKKKKKKKKTHTHTKLKCTQIHLFPFNGFIWQVGLYIFIALLLFLSWITNSPCLLLTLPTTTGVINTRLCSLKNFYCWDNLIIAMISCLIHVSRWFQKSGQKWAELYNLTEMKNGRSQVDRLPYKSLLQIVDVPIQYMFRYTNSDERCKRSAEEETISLSSLTTAASFLRTVHVKEYQLGGRLA